MSLPIMGTPVSSSFSNLANQSQVVVDMTIDEPDTLVCFLIMTWTGSATARTVTGFSFTPALTPTLRYQKSHRNLSFTESHSLTYYWIKIDTPGDYTFRFNLGGTGAMSALFNAIPFTNVDWNVGPFDPGTSPANPAVLERNSSPGGALSIACTSSGLSDLLSIAQLLSIVAGGVAANGYTDDINIAGVTGIRNLFMHKVGNDAAEVTGSHTAAFLLHDLIVGVQPPQPLAILAGSSSIANVGAGPSAAITYKNSAPCVMILALTTWGAGGFCPVTSVTDTSGVTWHRRKQTQFTSPNYKISNSVDSINQEIWWANQTAIHGSNVTVTAALANTPTFQATGTLIEIFGVIGSLVPATPWDINASSPVEATYSSAASAQNPSGAWHASSSAPMVLSFASQMTSAGAPAGVGVGFTSIGQINIGVSNQFSFGAEFAIKSAGSGSASWDGGSATRAYVLVNDALTSDTNGTADAAGVGKKVPPLLFTMW
jgi:hypothetical protein